MNPFEILFDFKLTLRSSRSSNYARGVTSSDTVEIRSRDIVVAVVTGLRLAEIHC